MTIKLFYQPEGRLRLTGDDRSWLDVRPVWASPLSYPGKYLSLLDGKGKQIVLVSEPSKELDRETWTTVKRELDRRYLSSTVLSIQSAKTVFGATYWSVTTERGEREFVTQSLQETAQWMSETFLLLVDVDGNRFEVPDINALDEQSRKTLMATV